MQEKNIQVGPYSFTPAQFTGVEKIIGNLDLCMLASIPKGFNPTVGGSLFLDNLTSIPKGFNPTVDGSLFLDNLTSIPEGFNPTVDGSLFLDNLTFAPKGFNPTVGGSLFLDNLTSIPEGFNPTVGGALYLSRLTSIPEGFNLTVGDTLYLSMLASVPNDFNPTVGGSLDLRSLTSIPEGFSPTVGHDLYLNSLASVPNDFNPTVGGALVLDSLASLPEGFDKSRFERQPINMLSWQNGRYIKVDGIFAEVISHKANVWKLKNINRPEAFFLVTDGQGHYAHGDSLKQATADLAFKTSDKDTSQYAHLTLRSVLDFETCVHMYRVVTGACAAGVRLFLETKGIETKSYTVKEMLELTEGQYGHSSFKEYVGNLATA